MSPGEQTGYVVPSYRAPGEEAWYHFLHGNVPGHQIDFMYRAEVPQGRLTRQHFSHLSRLMKYIEPQTNAPFAFAIGNLSRDDTQHEPGHGGVALIFGLRIRGVTDHAGRQDPPFSHGIAVIDRALDAQTIAGAARAFHKHVIGAAESAEWYRAYVRCAHEAPAEVERVLASYVASFDDMPSPPESSLGTRWIASAEPPPRRVVIAHADDAPFELIAGCASRIAAMLYPSDIRWTAISNGREADVPNGVTIRLVAESHLTAADEAAGPLWITDVPEDEAEIARQLFGALPAEREKPAPRGWRERYSAVGDGLSAESSVDIPVARSSWEGHAPAARPRSERPPPGYPRPAVGAKVSRPALAARDSAPVEIELGSVPVSDLDAETEHWSHRRSTPRPIAPERPSVDDEAVTVGAPLARAPAATPSASNGSIAGADIDVVLDEDDGGRQASFELTPPAPARRPAPRRPRPPAPPSGDGQVTLTAGFGRETMQLPVADARRMIADVLPFRPVETPRLPPAPERPSADEDEPDFRASPGAWKWLVVLALAVGAIILALYLAFAGRGAVIPGSSTIQVTTTAGEPPPPPTARAPVASPPTPSATPGAAPTATPVASATTAPSASSGPTARTTRKPPSSGRGKPAPTINGTGIFDPNGENKLQ